MNNWKYTKYFFIFIGCCAGSNILAQTNRALIITISNYPLNSGWESIHANNDKIYILEILSLKKYHPKHISHLSDAQATKAKIVKALTKLWSEMEDGDAVFLHFSCHGQQMMDDNGDEEDGLDESLVPYDARFKYISQQYEGENHLRDDELGIWINRLRRKAGEKGRVTVTLDACHSGTANRDGHEYGKDYKEYIRGTTAIFAPEGYTPLPGKHQELSMRLKEERGLATVAVFSACKAEFSNYEFYDKKRSLYVGKLTYIFCKMIKEVERPCTIFAFFQRLHGNMLSLKGANLRIQIPYMECSNKMSSFYIGQEK